MTCTELGLYLMLEDCFAGSQEGSEVFSLAFMKRLCVLLKWLLPTCQNTGAFQRVGPSVTQDLGPQRNQAVYSSQTPHLFL